MRPETSSVFPMLSLGILFLMAPAVQACFAKMMSGPHYAELSQRMDSIIPLPSPSKLDVDCKLLTEGLSYLLRVLSTPECRSQTSMVSTYNATLQAISIPCRDSRKEFLLGQACWNSQSLLKKMLMDCYTRTLVTISSNYCVGMLDFNRCVSASVLNVTGCGEREQTILTAMGATIYNTNGQAFPTACPLQPVPSWQETTTTTTISTTSPSPSATSTTAGPQAGGARSTPRADGDLAKDPLEEATSPATAPATKSGLLRLPSSNDTESGQDEKAGWWRSAASTSTGGPVVRARLSLVPLAALCLASFFLFASSLP